MQNKDEKRLQYKPVLELSREEMEEMLRSGIPEQVGEALWSAAYYDPDWRWVQSQCLLFLRHSDLGIQTNAVICLGVHVRFGGHLDLELVLPALHKAGEDPRLRPCVEDSLSDILHCINTVTSTSWGRLHHNRHGWRFASARIFNGHCKALRGDAG